MNRVSSRALVGGTLVALIGALAPACAENNQSLFIRQIMAPTAVDATTGSCRYIPDATQPGLALGILDVGLTDAYYVTALVGNQLIRRRSREDLRAESNNMIIKSGITRVLDGDRVLAEITGPTQGFIDAAEGDARYGTIGFVAVDPGGAQTLRGALQPGEVRTVTLGMKISGTSLGGEDVESGEFLWPLRVCNGCLVDFSAGDDPATPGVDCSLPSAANSVRPCTFGQDQIVPCQLCRDRPVCNPAATP